MKINNVAVGEIILLNLIQDMDISVELFFQLIKYSASRGLNLVQVNMGVVSLSKQHCVQL